MESCDVLIIGGGAMGLSAALALGRAGREVLVVNPEPVLKGNNASTDINKAFRIEYGADTFYSEWAMESRQAWITLEEQAEMRLMERCGILMFGEAADSFALQSREALQPLGIAPEMWLADEVRKRYPQFQCKQATYSNLGGMLLADRALETLVKLMPDTVRIQSGVRIKEVDKHTATDDKGNTIAFQQVLYAAGGWVSQLLDLPVQRPSAVGVPQTQTHSAILT